MNKTLASGPHELRPVLALMRSQYRVMSPAYRELADHVLEYSYQAAFASASNLGRAVGLSSATVVRFAESLGLTGYTHLQRLARESMHREVNTVSQMKSLSRLSKGESVLDKTLRADIENLGRTRELVSEQTFQRVVRLLAEAQTIQIAGFRSTYSVAHLLAFNLAMIGRRTSLLMPGVGDLPEQLLRMRSDDVCIVISFRRYSRQTMDVLHAARECGAKSIAITDSDRSPLNDVADISLPVSVRFPAYFESRVGAISLTNALAMGVALATRRTTLESLRRCEQAWKDNGTYLREGVNGEHKSRLRAFEFMKGR